MRAIVKTKKGEGFLEMQERPLPQIENDEVLIRVSYAGICGTDIHIKHDQYPYWPPVIIGHEFSGIVEKTGEDVRDFSEGDHVVGEPHNLHCGKCELCRTGNIQLCLKKRSIGWGIDGAFAEYVKMPESLLHKIPEGVSLSDAAMAEPCAIVAHQLLERGRILPGQTVVIMGLGPIALIAAQMAKIAGAGKIIMCGCNSDEGIRLAALQKLSACDRFINVQKENAEEVLKEEMEKGGVDVVVEASGAASAIRSGVRLLKKKGLFCGIGMTNNEEIPFPWNMAMQKAIDLQFNMSSSFRGWEMALSLLKSGKLRTEELYEIRQLSAFEAAFEDLEKGNAIKILLSPSAE